MLRLIGYAAMCIGLIAAVTVSASAQTISLQHARSLSHEHPISLLGENLNSTTLQIEPLLVGRFSPFVSTGIVNRGIGCPQELAATCDTRGWEVSIGTNLGFERFVDSAIRPYLGAAAGTHVWSGDEIRGFGKIHAGADWAVAHVGLRSETGLNSEGWFVALALLVRM